MKFDRFVVIAFCLIRFCITLFTSTELSLAAGSARDEDEAIRLFAMRFSCLHRSYKENRCSPQNLSVVVSELRSRMNMRGERSKWTVRMTPCAMASISGIPPSFEEVTNFARVVPDVSVFNLVSGKQQHVRGDYWP